MDASLDATDVQDDLLDVLLPSLDPKTAATGLIVQMVATEDFVIEFQVLNLTRQLEPTSQQGFLQAREPFLEGLAVQSFLLDSLVTLGNPLFVKLGPLLAHLNPTLDVEVH